MFNGDPVLCYRGYSSTLFSAVTHSHIMAIVSKTASLAPLPITFYQITQTS
jgi:hypothetical protein